MSKKVRVRFAPSPTGPLHIGGVRTALLNYLFAKKNGGDFLLRIEDTDRHRFVPGAEEYIIKSLSWLGIKFDDGIETDVDSENFGKAKYRQSERDYKSYALSLIESGHAYYAFDTPAELETLRKALESAKAMPGYTFKVRDRMKNSLTLSADETKNLLDSGAPYVIRFNAKPSGNVENEVVFDDIVRGTVRVTLDNIDDKVLFKSDGLPTYHLANIVDDHLMEITHVIRGDEWLPSAPMHVLLYKAFGWDAPEFCHLPLILGPDKQKLSKRHGDKYGFPVFPITWDYVNEKNESIHITGFKDEGYEPEALLNFLALLGWNPGDNKEFMTMEEMVELFGLDRVNNSGAMFDIAKLKNFNTHYLRTADNKYLYKTYIRPFIEESLLRKYGSTKNKAIVEVAKERAEFGKDLFGTITYFFDEVVLKDDVVLKNANEFIAVMEEFIVNYSVADHELTETEIHDNLEELCVKHNLKLGKIMPDLRMALTGGLPGPSLALTIWILGKEVSMKRINNLLDKAWKSKQLI